MRVKTKSPHWKKNAYLFVLGQGLTMFGTMMVHYAITWHVTLQTNSSTAIALFSVAMVLPMFFISPFGGVWADRYNRKLIINISDGAIAVITLVMALLYAGGITDIWLLLVCVLVRSFGQGIQTPASSSLIPQIVPPDELAKFNGLQATVQSVVGLAAPAAGGAILSFAPLPVVMFLDVATAAIGILTLIFAVKVPTLKRTAAQHTSYFADIKSGLGYVRKSRMLVAFLCFSAVFNILIAPVSIITPLHIARVWGDAYWRLTVNEAVFFAGMMLGGALIAAWGGFKNKSWTMTVATAGFGLFSALLGMTQNFWVYAALMGLAGLTMPLFNAPMMTVLQTKVAPEYMGRVFSVATMIATLAMPVGSIILAPLGEEGRVPISLLLLISGILVFLSSAFFLFNQDMREAGLPENENDG